MERRKKTNPQDAELILSDISIREREMEIYKGCSLRYHKVSQGVEAELMLGLEGNM